MYPPGNSGKEDIRVIPYPKGGNNGQILEEDLFFFNRLPHDGHWSIAIHVEPPVLLLGLDIDIHRCVIAHPRGRMKIGAGKDLIFTRGIIGIMHHPGVFELFHIANGFVVGNIDPDSEEG